jgi:hypothetical protein
MKTAKDYYTTHLFEPFEWSGGCNPISIAPQLIGRLWDDLALGILHAYNPTYIRVTEGDIKCDARLGRITVWVTDQNIIESIDQEVEIGIPGTTKAEIDRNHELIDAILARSS